MDSATRRAGQRRHVRPRSLRRAAGVQVSRADGAAVGWGCPQVRNNRV